MRKYTLKSPKKVLSLSLLCRRVLTFGIPPIFLSLILTAWQITDSVPLTLARASYFGGMLEYHVAAITLLTVGAYLAERVARASADK